MIVGIATQPPELRQPLERGDRPVSVRIFLPRWLRETFLGTASANSSGQLSTGRTERLVAGQRASATPRPRW